MTRGQLVALGLSPVEITRAKKAGRIKRAGSAVYELQPSQDAWRHALLRATLELPQAVISHRAAALLHGLDGVECAPVELSVRSWIRNRRGIKSHCVGDLEESDCTAVDGFRVTSVSRTLMDLAAVISEERLAWAVEHAWRRGDINPQELRLRFDRMRSRGKSGARKLDVVLADCERRLRPLESALEVRLWRLLRRNGLRPEPQFSVWHGKRSMRIDFAFLYERLAVETVGRKSHEGEGNLERDSRRALLLSALGWSVVPVTWKMLEKDTPRVLARIQETLRTHDPRFTRHGFEPGQLGLSDDYLIRPVPQVHTPPRRTRAPVIVLRTPRRPPTDSSELEMLTYPEETPAAGARDAEV